MMMKAAQIVAPQTIEIVETQRPDVSNALPGSVLVKVQKSAICGSDLPRFDFAFSEGDYPLPAGLSIHECIGVIAQSTSDKFKEGDAVLSLPHGDQGLAEYFLSHADQTVLLPPFQDKEALDALRPKEKEEE